MCTMIKKAIQIDGKWRFLDVVIDESKDEVIVYIDGVRCPDESSITVSDKGIAITSRR